MRNPTRPLALASLSFVAVFAMLAYGTGISVCAIVGVALCALTFGYTLFYGKNMKKAVAAVIFAAAFCVFGLISGLRFANEVSFSRSLVSEVEHNIVFRIDGISYAAPYGSCYYATCDELDGKSEKFKLCVELPFDAGLCENDVASAVGTFDGIDEYTAYFESDGIFVSFDADEIKYIRSDDADIFDKIKSLNATLAQKLYFEFSSDEGAVAAALSLGNKTYLSSKTKLDFKRAGASHVLAVSGMHLSVLVLAVEFLLKNIGRKSKYIILILVSLGFMALSGFSFSVCRAAIMMSIYFLSKLAKEESDGITSLSLAMVIIISVSHQSVFDAGFWLSCLATLGILIIVPAVKLGFLKATKDDSRIIRVLKKTAKAVIITFVTSAAAQMFTLPVIYVCFGGISLASLISGIIIIPLSEICMILSMLSCVFMFVPVIKTGVLFIAKGALSLLIFVVNLFSDIDGVYVSLTLPFVKYVIAACAAVTVIYIFIKKADRRFILLIGLAGIISVGIGFAVTNVCSRGNTDMIYSRLGTNESIVVKSEGNVIAFDISNGSRASLMMAQSGAESLSGGQIDYLVLTHLHSNHISSVSKLCGNIKVKNLLIPSAQNESDAAVIRGLRDAIGDDVNISFYNRASESALLCGELSVTLPTYRLLKRSTHPVIVFEFEQRGHKVLYFGASALDDADDALCEALSDSECAIIGAHGPKAKEPILIDYFSAPTVICEIGEAIIGGEKRVFAPTDYESGIHIRFTDK